MSSELIMGVDEAGRGCLAGPVFAAAVILPSREEHGDWISNIRDSKKLSEKKRKELADLIMAYSFWHVSFSSIEDIFRYNILNATKNAMVRSVEAVATLQEPDIVLVDGNFVLPGLYYEQRCIKGGDDIIKEIGAASILAKVLRDDLMNTLHEVHPEYGWNRNKGYGTAEHRQAIMEYGPTSFHRRAFRGVAEYVQG